MNSKNVLVEIGAGPYRAEVSTFGGGLWSLTYEGTPLVVTPPLPDRGISLRSPVPFDAGNLLAPWPNRVDAGDYVYRGNPYRLEITEASRNNAIHGFVRHLNWEVTSGTPPTGPDSLPANVTLSLTQNPQPGWPWTLQYLLTWTIDSNDGLNATLKVTNLSDTDCPFGFGWHPYLSARGQRLDACNMHASLDTHLVLERERNLPTGEERPAAEVTGEATEVPLSGLWLDHAFTTHPGPDGRVRATLCGTDGRGVELHAGDWCKWLQIYTADAAHDEAFPGVENGRALAVEPMTCPPDALNSGRDLIVLVPGASRDFDFGLRAFSK